MKTQYRVVEKDSYDGKYYIIEKKSWYNFGWVNISIFLAFKKIESALKHIERLQYEPLPSKIVKVFK